MDQETLQRIIQQQMNGAMQQQESCLEREPTVEELDLFIDRCCKEKDETLMTLGQALHFKIQPPQDSKVTIMNTLPEVEILPMVLQRIQARLNEGEK